MKHVLRFCALIIVLAGGVAGYQAFRQNHTVAGLRDALDESRAAYDGLANDYNHAVRRSAITELIVNNGELSVVVKTPFGDVETIPTPYDPRREIYVDYVVVDGRVWVRRVFDDLTSPSQGTIIESRFGSIDWDSLTENDFGKAVYRKLTDGRWAVTVTGNGALGLEKVSPDTDVQLVEPPAAVKRYDAVKQATE